MKNLNKILYFGILFLSIQTSCEIIQTREIPKRKRTLSQIRRPLETVTVERNLELVRKPEPKLNKKSRNLFLSDLTGGELLGLGTGLKGIYEYAQGEKNYEDNLDEIHKDEYMGKFNLLMTKKANSNKLVTMIRTVASVEERIDDYEKDISSKLQQFRVSLMA